MEAGTQESLPGTERKSSGRKNSTGIEETVKIPTLKASCPHLMKLLRKAQEATTDYKEALTAVCEANKANGTVVNKLIKASLKGNFEDVRRDVEQQQIIFEGVGEVSDSGK